MPGLHDLSELLDLSSNAAVLKLAAASGALRNRESVANGDGGHNGSP